MVPNALSGRTHPSFGMTPILPKKIKKTLKSRCRT